MPGMKALILQHSHTCTPGTSIEWLRSRGIPHDILMARDIDTWPAMDSFDLLILCGGGMDVDQEAIHPWLKPEKQFINAAIQQKKKILGLCLGAQLIADVMGARVYPNSAWETGWHTVQLPATGENIKVFEWHAYTFDLPKGAELLATNSNCRNQAYRVGSQILAYQFHPEADEEWVMLRAMDPKAPKEGFIQPAYEVREGIALYQKRMQHWFFSRLDEWALKAAGR
jgi:GMP synthase-like glutamine amidotransferase